MTTCAVLIPVLGRPHRVRQVCESLRRASDDRARPVFLCSPGDHDEIAAIQQAGIEPIIVGWQPGPGDYARKMNLGFTITDDPYVFLGADDLNFYPAWLQVALLVQERTGACVIGTNDLGNPRVRSGRHSTHSLVHRGYGECGTIDDPSRLLHEGYDHQYVDDEFIQTAQARETYEFAATSYVEHLHPHWGKAPTDDTYAKGQRAFAEDQALYTRRRHLWEGTNR